MRFSASMLGTWIQCPLQARFKYIDRIAVDKESAASHFGTCIHSAMEQYTHERDVDKAVGYFTNLWDEIPMGVWYPRTTSFSGYQALGQQIVRTYHEAVRWENRKILGTEHPFCVPFGDHELQGYVDLLESSKDSKGKLRLKIVDWKAQPLDTPTLTPEGWIPFGKLKMGDEVISRDGRPTEVTGVYPQGKVDAVRIHFTDGSVSVCSEEHLWTVIDIFGNRGQYGPTEKVLEVQEFGPLQRGWNNRYFVPTAAPVQFSPRALPLDPYVLGVLIGDGALTQLTPGFTKPNPELHERVRGRLPQGYQLNVKNELGDCSIVESVKIHRENLVMSVLKDLGLAGTTSLQRFIPEEYLLASVGDRKLLLAGLMDTDGGSSNRNQFYTSSERLKDDWVHLCRSLGGVPRWSASLSYYTIEGKRKYCAVQYHCSPRVPFNPFLDSKKSTGWHVPKERLDRGIKKIERLNQAVEMQCISVAHPSGTYITDEFVVTHNTASRQPSRVALTQNIQMTAYYYSSLQPEFWLGTDEIIQSGDRLRPGQNVGDRKYPGFENGEELWEQYKDAKRSVIWYHLRTNKAIDAGPRDMPDFMRLYRAAKEIERAIEHEVYVPDIGADSCLWCDFHQPCGLPLKENYE